MNGTDDDFERGAALLARLSPEGARPPWEALEDIAPALGRSIGTAFGALMDRPGLDLRTREIVTVAVLAALGGCEPQVGFHTGAALRAGATAQEIVEALTQVSVYAGIPRALNAVAAARPVLLDAGVDTAAARAPRAVVIGFLAAIAERNWTAARELLAAEVSWTLPGARSNGDEARTRSGRDDLEAFASRVRPLLDMERVRVESALPAGEVVYVPLHDRQRRTHRDQGNDEAAVLEVSTRDGRIVGVAVHGHLDGLVTLLTGGAE